MYLDSKDADWVCGVIVPRDAVSPFVGWVDIGWKIKLEGMEAKCPHCGFSDRLHVGQWRAILPESNEFCRPIEELFGVDLNSSLCDGFDVVDISFSEIPDEAVSQTTPLAVLEKYYLPTGFRQGLLESVKCWLRGRTSLDASSDDYLFGLRGGYLGAYECPSCHQVYGVSFKAEHLHRQPSAIKINADALQDYPPSFLNDLYNRKTCKALKLGALNLMPQYKDIEDAFKKSGLPNGKRTRRAAFARPLIIAAAAQGEKMPFENIDILGDLIEHDEAPWLIYALGWGSSAWLWEYFARAKGERRFFEWVISQGYDRLFSESKRVADLVPVPDMQAALSVADDLFEDKSIEWALSNLNLLSFIGRNSRFSSGDDEIVAQNALAALNTPYEYTERQKKLAMHLPEGTFRLPTTPRDLIALGDLHGDWHASRRPEDVSERNTFVAVCAGEWNVPAIIRVDVENQRVISAAVDKQQPIQLLADTDKAFQKWLTVSGLLWNPSQESR